MRKMKCLFDWNGNYRLLSCVVVAGENHVISNLIFLSSSIHALRNTELVLTRNGINFCFCILKKLNFILIFQVKLIFFMCF
jgi:hypothetical protein